MPAVLDQTSQHCSHLVSIMQCLSINEDHLREQEKLAVEHDFGDGDVRETKMGLLSSSAVPLQYVCCMQGVKYSSVNIDRDLQQQYAHELSKIPGYAIIG